MRVPDHARRLFAHLADDPEAPPAAILERLLEDGDRRDLRWLTRSMPEQMLAAWLRDRGARQLSDRSRAFWSLLLDQTAPGRRAEGADLWPL